MGSDVLRIVGLDYENYLVMWLSAGMVLLVAKMANGCFGGFTTTCPAHAGCLMSRAVAFDNPEVALDEESPSNEDLFARADADGNGCVTFKELSAAHERGQDLEVPFNESNTDQDDCVSWEEFMAWMARQKVGQGLRSMNVEPMYVYYGPGMQSPPPTEDPRLTLT